ncbi:MAG: zinc ribbon domain-containing protein, partial [Oscillospiraceae bacterium]|nr:zinc ribbon domain-containing protein [Oscillospiraceae bacterium]
MMKCAKCGQELPENAVFCTCCGEKVTGAAQGDGRPIYESEVKGWLKSGKLSVYRDRVEFSASSAQKTVFDYASLVAVKKRLLPTPAILFITEDA